MDDVENLVLLGCSHKSAPLDVREKFFIAPPHLPNIYGGIKKVPSLINECLILNTCNRLELYGVVKPNKYTEKLLKLFCNTHDINYGAFRKYSFQQRGLNVVQHVFEVASGIDSQMVGETEILGQLKNAYKTANIHSTLGPKLNRVFQKSFQAAKWARTHTEISKGQISIGNIAVVLAQRIFENISKVRILVIGSGEVAEKSIQALISRGAQTVNITNRTFEKARKLADQFNRIAIDYQDFTRHIDQFDIIISSVTSPENILNAPIFKKAMEKRLDRPMFVIDVGMPRNVCEDVGELPEVYLYNLNDISSIANENLRSRQSEIEKCRSVLKQKAQHVWEQILSKDTPPIRPS